MLICSLWKVIKYGNQLITFKKTIRFVRIGGMADHGVQLLQKTMGLMKFRFRAGLSDRARLSLDNNMSTSVKIVIGKCTCKFEGCGHRKSVTDTEFSDLLILNAEADCLWVSVLDGDWPTFEGIIHPQGLLPPSKRHSATTLGKDGYKLSQGRAG
jgi:hypothetical protein